MTAIAAQIALTATPRSSEERSRAVRAMLAHMLGRAPDAARLVTSERLTLTRGAITGGTPREATIEARVRADGVLVVADARLDDDAAIDGAYDRGVDPAHETPDELAIRAAYATLGEACAARLVGDFAFILVDTARRKVVLSRDALGNRSLYFAEHAGVLSVATEAQAALEGARLEQAPNRESIARFLVNGYTDNGATLLEGVESVPPGHTLVFEGGAVRALRHTHLDEVASLPEQGDEDYARRLRCALEVAVTRRMRRARGVGITLSGGMDSSSVAAVAEHVRRREGRIDEPILALHSRYGALDCDETSPSRAVTRYVGLRSAEVDMVSEHAWSSPENALVVGAPPYYPSAFAFDAHFVDAMRLGVDTVLSGEGGDACLTRTPFDRLEQLRRGDVAPILRRALHPALSRASLLRTYDATLRQAIPWRLRQALGPLRRRGTDPILSSTWHARMEAERVREEVRWERSRRADPRTAALVRWLDGAGQQLCTSRLAYFARRRGIALEHPFLDVDVVRLLLALPHEQRHAPWTDKSKPVLRRAMRGLLPPSVLSRGDAAEYSSFVRACLRQHAALFAELERPSRLIELGLVRDDLRLDWETAGDLPLFYRKLSVATMELWLRQRHP